MPEQGTPTGLSNTWEREEAPIFQKNTWCGKGNIHPPGFHNIECDGDWLTELIPSKKEKQYSTAISKIKAHVSFSVSQSAFVCLRGSRNIRKVQHYIKNNDIDIDVIEGAIS